MSAPIFTQINATVEIIAPMAEKHINVKVCANENDGRNECVEIADQNRPEFSQSDLVDSHGTKTKTTNP